MQIPVEFKLTGQTIEGVLSKVSGGGNVALWHLMVSDFYWGQLICNAQNKWVFHSQKGDPELDLLGKYFGDVIEKKKPE